MYMKLSYPTYVNWYKSTHIKPSFHVYLNNGESWT